MTPYYSQDGITLFLGDCREILPQLTEKVDLVLTDPPYGVGLGETDNGQARDKGQTAYADFSDTPEYIQAVVIPAFKTSLGLSQRGIITPGNRNAWLYPKPDDIGVWYNPAGAGMGKWGFVLAHLILYYGKDQRAGVGTSASSTWGHHERNNGIKNSLHPCPKPVPFMKWLVEKGSLEGDLVLDPFLGSGTTAVACKQLGRRCLGVEISERYLEIAVRRLAQMQIEFK